MNQYFVDFMDGHDLEFEASHIEALGCFLQIRDSDGRTYLIPLTQIRAVSFETKED